MKTTQTEEIELTPEQITETIKKVLPNFWVEVSNYKGFAGDYVAIKIACSNHAINGVRGQLAQVVSLSLNLDTLWLEPQSYGGNGGQAIYREPNMEDPREKYLAMKSVRVPFRRPPQTPEAVMKGIRRFAENYLQTLREHAATLCYQDIVNYSELLK